MDESLSSKKLTLYRDMNGLTCPTGVFRNEDVKEFIKRKNEEKEDLKRQLLIDFKVPMTEKSAKRFIESRFKISNNKDKKLAGKGLGEE